MSKLEAEFALQLSALKIPYTDQVRVDKVRRWRWDFRVKDILIDIQGGTWTGGRHVRGTGYQNDCDKANAAVKQGYKVLRFTGQDVKSGAAMQFLESML